VNINSIFSSANW